MMKPGNAAASMADLEDESDMSDYWWVTVRTDKLICPHCLVLSPWHKKSIRKNYIEYVRVLLKDNNVDSTDGDNASIISASTYGHFEIVKLLLKDPRVNPADKNNTSIIRASVNGYAKIVELLLKDDRVDPSDDGNKAIKFASEYGHPNVVILLLTDVCQF